MPHYNAYSRYLKERFGKPVRKISLDAGFSCPNRDGTISLAGCVFCDNRAFSPVAGSVLQPVDQLKTAMARFTGKGWLFIAYLQPFSNTYAPIDCLYSIYEPLLEVPDVIGLSIGTRPDCLSEEVYCYLSDLASRTYLSIELGLQSANDQTLKLLNRGHGFAEFETAVQRLSKLGIETVAHVMLGLPGESAKVMLETADAVASLPVQGVKIHQIMLIKGTPMEGLYAEGKVQAMTLSEYAPLVSEFIRRLRPDQQIHRIMADTRRESGLIAPEWSCEKQKSIRFLHAYMDDNSVVQGSNYFAGVSPNPPDSRYFSCSGYQKAL